MPYVQIPKEAMFQALTPGGFLPVQIEGTKEQVYDRPFKFNPNLVIRVYTTIEGDYSRDCGADAIRVVLFDKEINRAVGRADTKTLRVEKWRENLQAKINTVFMSVKGLKKCNYCGRYMVIRKGKNGEFLGCSAYPTCKTTAKLTCFEETK